MPNEPLSEQESAQLAARLAELSAAQLPLAPGLRAAAAELDRGRLARAMESLTADLERGQTLEQALAAERGRFPSTFAGLVAAGARTGRLGEVLEEFVDFRQFIADMRHSVWTALAYPLFLVVITIGLFFVFAEYVGPMLADTYRGFRFDMAVDLRAIDGLHDALPYVLAAAALAVLLGVVMYSLRSLAIVWRVLTWLPVIGRLWRFAGMAEFARLLRVLLEQGVPLPQALRLTAGGITNADVAVGCRHLAARVESGESLATALAGTSQFGPIERPIIAWGEQQSALPAALATIDTANLRRLQVWSMLLRSTLPLVLLLFIFAGVLFVLSSFRALLALISNLSSWGGPTPSAVNINIGLPTAEGVLSAAILAIALWISLRLVYAGRRSGDGLHILLRIVVAVLLLSTALGLFIDLLAGLGFLLWFVSLIVWGIVVFRLRRAQRQMFIDLLALTAERSLPIAPVMRALALEEQGAIGYRAGDFADRLDAGYPVADALLATPRLLGPQDELAIDVGQQTGSLPVTLQTLAGDPLGAGRYGEGLWIGSLSLWYVANVLIGCVLFVTAKIVPAYEKIFKDFRGYPGQKTGYTRVELPPVTQAFISIVHSIYDVFAVLVIPLAIVVPLLTFYLLAYLMGWVRFELPLVNRFFAPRHSAVLLRWLAAAVRREQSLWPITQRAADRYPNRLIRSRLRSAARQIEAGGNWIDAFRGNRLIARSDAAILRAASKAGNLAWALDEAAAANLRRLSYKLQAIGEFLLPLAIILAGGCVLFFTLSMFMPLVTLISELAK